MQFHKTGRIGAMVLSRVARAAVPVDQTPFSGYSYKKYSARIGADYPDCGVAIRRIGRSLVPPRLGIRHRIPESLAL